MHAQHYVFFFRELEIKYIYCASLGIIWEKRDDAFLCPANVV